jgi:dihydropteroate synthase
VDADEELRRVIPVIAGLAAAVDVPISIDTSKAAVAEAALQAG